MIIKSSLHVHTKQKFVNTTRDVARLDYRGLVQRVNRLLPGFRAQVDPFIVQFPVLISAGTCLHQNPNAVDLICLTFQ